jgi:two-component system CheB/CheR fusion protein
LHVEDELIVRKAMALLLSSEGYTVISAANGPEALRLVADGICPDLLIVDFNLDDTMNGAETAEELRRALGYAPPVVMLTGNPASAEFPWITDAPVWLAHKPMSPELFLAALPGLIQLSRATRELHKW